jgi:hypothetical protein
MNISFIRNLQYGDEMPTEMGEYVVGAYLQHFKNCDFVEYNIRPRGGGLEGLNEFDVVGIDLENKIMYLCEVATHLRGLNMGSSKGELRLMRKFPRQQKFSDGYKDQFTVNCMFWSPRVRPGMIEKLGTPKGVELIINEKYARCVDDLIKKAKKEANETGNPFFRALQIIGHLKSITPI